MQKGQAGRARRGASTRRGALIARREASGGARLELGLATRSSPAFRRALRRPLHAFVKRDHAARAGRAHRGRPPDPRGQESRTPPGARALFARTATRRRRSTTAPTSCWSGARASTSRALPRGAKIDLPQLVPGSPRTGTPTCSSRSASRPSGAGTTRTSRARCSAFEPLLRRSPPASPTPRRCSPRSRSRRGMPGHDPGPRRLRSSTSATRSTVLLTFGTVLTWVERKQAAVMSDRIGANRAYIRIPFTQVKLVWLGPVPRHGRRPQDAAEGGLEADDLRQLRLRASRRGSCSRRCCSCSRSSRSAASLDPAQLLRRHPGARRVVRRPHVSDADRAARRAACSIVFAFGGIVDHRRDARRLVVVEQVLDAGRAARRLADDLLRARDGAHGARPDPHLRHASTSTRSSSSSRGSLLGVPAGVGHRSTSRSRRSCS